jgi:2-polyprenyl-6-methoxyphenol hydroxylase-like FAD-dependent oxidoreductase
MTECMIAGGGVGGLATALSLHAAGIRNISVFESASSVQELGVGINLLPHAVRELSELGLEAALAEEAIPTAALIFYSKRGQEIWQEPRGQVAGYNWPQFSIHRGTLLRILYEAVVERLGAERVHHGHRLLSFEEASGGSRVRARFETDRGANTKEVDADLLIGADGVHSTVRAQLNPGEGPPKWNGVTMWRGVSEGPAVLDGKSMVMAGTFARRIVVYPISRAHYEQGSARINWVAEVRLEDAREMPPQEWEHRGRLEDVLEHFGGYSFDWLDFPALAKAAPEIFQYPMVDRDPLPAWRRGPVTLLGDAAHPMYPVGSNGASQGILDARILAMHLAQSPDVFGALDAYEDDRRPATGKIVELNRQVGPEQCMEIVEERAPEGFARIEDVISRAELEEIAARYKRAAGFDRETLNGRPSYSVAGANTS